LGAKGFAGYYLLKELRRGIDPLSPENILLLAPGVLTGTPGPGLNRFTAAAKSPLTGVYGESEAGGWWGPELKFAGYDAIIIHGRASSPVYLWIDDGKVELRDARHLWGLNVGEASDALREELGEAKGRKVRVLTIGRAGEHLVRYAALVNELHYFNGRNGMGAVMGSKNLKAVVCRGTNPPALARPDEVMDIVKWHAREFKNDPRGGALNAGGTPIGVAGQNAAGTLPTYYFRSGAFPQIATISYEAYKAEILSGAGTCYACPVRCKREVTVNEGEYKADPRYGGPEYETVAAFGSNMGIANLKAIATASDLCARYGLDSISTGSVIAFTMECYERGLLTKERTGGLDLSWGNDKAVLQLIRMIGEREGLGDLLANGVRATARVLGPEAEEVALHVKGQEVPMHEPRGKFGVGLGYAISETGAEHLRIGHDTLFVLADSVALKSIAPLGLLEPLDPRDTSAKKVRMYTYLENVSMLWNCVGACYFVYAPRGFFPLETFVTMTRAITGWDTSMWELLKAAERAVNLARIFNVREGLTPADDRLPKRFFEPLQGGRLEGQAIDPTEFQQALHLLYRMKGWDPTTGAPERWKLAELDIEWAADMLGAAGVP